jgi:hypothetical protein
MPTPNDFSRLNFAPQDSNYRMHGDERSGEFAENAAAPEAPTLAEDTYPGMLNDSRYGSGANPFSTDVEADPKLLHQEARESVDAHADLMRAYGYGMPIATLGSHPWLRDDMADRSTREPGQAEPEAPLGIPQQKAVKE